MEVNKRDPRLDQYQSDSRYCEECCRQRAFVNGECVACTARQQATPEQLVNAAVHRSQRMRSAAFHDFCRMVEP